MKKTIAICGLVILLLSAFIFGLVDFGLGECVSMEHYTGEVISGQRGRAVACAMLNYKIPFPIEFGTYSIKVKSNTNNIYTDPMVSEEFKTHWIGQPVEINVITWETFLTHTRYKETVFIY